MEKAYFNWSSGKDSALALYTALNSKKYDILYLFTVIKKNEAKIAMHEISLNLLQKQADAIGIPFLALEYDPDAGNVAYQSSLAEQINLFKSQGITAALFGDIYLENFKKEREKNCDLQGIRADFPIWGKNSKFLLEEFINAGFKSIVTCVDSNRSEIRDF